MPKQPGIGQRDAVRVLEKRGFRIVRQGKHLTLSNGAVMLLVPRHTVINAYTMGYIAKVAGLNRPVSGSRQRAKPGCNIIRYKLAGAHRGTKPGDRHPGPVGAAEAAPKAPGG